MHDLSTRAKFYNARFQSPLLIMSKIFSEIQFVYRKMEKMLRTDQFRQQLEVLVANTIANEMYDLSARAKFSDAHFQSPL